MQAVLALFGLLVGSVVSSPTFLMRTARKDNYENRMRRILEEALLRTAREDNKKAG